MGGRVTAQAVDRTKENAIMNERMSPDKKHVVKWRWGGEMWMSGPEWGWLTVDENEEIKGVTPEDVIWSEDSQFMAFVKLHIEDVPNRQGVEGLSFRVGVMRMADYTVRYCFGNRQLSELKLQTITPQLLTVSVNGELRTIELGKVEWDTR